MMLVPTNAAVCIDVDVGIDVVVIAAVEVVVAVAAGVAVEDEEEVVSKRVLFLCRSKSSGARNTDESIS